MNNQTFHGVLNKPKSAVITPFPNGKFECKFTVKDYTGNECNFNFNFEVDSSLEAMKPASDTSLNYIDVPTGDIFDGKVNDLTKHASPEVAGGAVRAISSNLNVINNSDTVVANISNNDRQQTAGNTFGDNKVPNNTPKNLNNDVVDIVINTPDIAPDPNLLFEGFPPNPPFAF